MNPALFQELEAAIRAVEPRVLEGSNPDLTDAEIDALMANVSFDLPDDLRALYRWGNGHRGTGYGGFLGALWWLAELKPSDDDSNVIRDEFDYYYGRLLKESSPLDLENTNFLYLFYDGAGYDLVACCFKNQNKTCEVRNREKGGGDFSLLHCGVEPMIQTTLECWKSGVFHSPYEHQFGWGLEEDFDKEFEIGRRLNPDCDYWFDGAAQ